MKDAFKVIDELRNNYLTLSDNEIKEYFASLPEFGVTEEVLTEVKGTFIVRGRVNCNGERFAHKKDISYKPAEQNKLYQRASIPNKTMFYGTIGYDENGERNHRMSIGITLFESIKLIRDNRLMSSGEEVITLGFWKIIKPLKCFTLAGAENFHPKNIVLKNLYQKFILLIEEKNRQDLKLIYDFISDEFAKPINGNSFEYKVSANFAELIVEKGFDGVIYPSVMTDGENGYNIALTPDAANNKLQLVYVEERTVFKNKEKMITEIDYLTEEITDEKINLIPNRKKKDREEIINNLYFQK